MIARAHSYLLLNECKWHRWLSWIRPYLLFILIIFGDGSGFVCAATLAKDDNDAIERANILSVSQLIIDGQCQNAWNRFWSAEQKRDSLSTAWIAATVYVGHPFRFTYGYDPQVRNLLLAMIFHANSYRPPPRHVSSDQEVNMNDFRGLAGVALDAIATPGSAKEKVKSCLSSKKDTIICTNLAVNVGILPTFERYVADIRRLSLTKMRVTCEANPMPGLHEGK